MSIKSREVVDGGSLDSELTIGGILNLNTRWLDFEGGVRDLSEVSDYDLKFEIGATSWSETLDDDGTISILITPSTIQVSSEFEISEGNRNVSYSGGQGIAIRAGQDSPLKTLNVERESNQDISATAVGESRKTVSEVDQSCTNDRWGWIHRRRRRIPDDSSEWRDLDGDGIGDNEDNDDDNDGHLDSIDEVNIYAGGDNFLGMRLHQC